MKQISMMAILGLALVLAIATVLATTQSAQAGGFGRGFGNPGGSASGPPGLTTACGANSNVQLHNPNCPQAG